MSEHADRSTGTRHKRTLPEPRSWIVNDPDRTKFGRGRPVFNRAGLNDNDLALCLAAEKQHRFARDVRQRINDPARGLTTVTVATAAGMTVDQLRRILRGEVHLTYADANLIALHTGDHVPGIRRTDPRAQHEVGR